MFWKNLTKFNDNIAIIDTVLARKITYSESSDNINYLTTKIRFENALCLILTANDYQSIISYLTVLTTSNAVMFLDQKIQDDFLQNIINLYEPEFVFSSVLKKLKEYDLNKIIVGDYIIYMYEKITLINNTQPLKTKLLLSTSGSTGSSKFVRLSSENIQANAESISEYLNINSYDKAITSLPIYYSFGLSVVNSHLLSGGTIVLTEETIIQKKFWQIFKKYNCTTFSGVPYTYQILHKLKLVEQNLPSLKYFTQAGGHLVSSIKKYFYELAKAQSKKFIVMYGQTEATARISYVPFEELEKKIDSIGIAIPKGFLSISGDIEIAEGREIGELIYKGPNVMLGYAEQKIDILKDDELHGLLFTGDLGYIDNSGYFYITGRGKRFIKLFGKRINLDEVERLIENKNKINCAVTGDDSAILVLFENHDNEKINNIREELAYILSIHHASIKWKSVVQIPVGLNSKKNYEQIMKLFKDK